ncbi:MAG: hypothetical protein HY062_03390 [Bacteroidetes bacterium]|nr:hypothetical protein [Bacteroidota bacterium]
MKKIIINASLLIAFTSLFIIGCKKKDTSSPEEESTPTTTGSTTGTPAASGSFTWTENGGAVNTADSSFWTTGTWGTGFRAFKGGYTNYFEINWANQNNTSVGSKSLTAGSFTFLKGSATYTNAASENLVVSAFASNALTGGFTVSVSGGTVTTIVGGFNAIPKK